VLLKSNQIKSKQIKSKQSKGKPSKQSYPENFEVVVSALSEFFPGLFRKDGVRHKCTHVRRSGIQQCLQVNTNEIERKDIKIKINK
jgi:hypothetical protein